MFALNVIPRVSGAIARVRGTDGTIDPPTRLCNILIKIFWLRYLTLKRKSILALSFYFNKQSCEFDFCG